MSSNFGQLVSRNGQLNDKIRDIVFASHAYFSHDIPQILNFIQINYPQYYENIKEALDNAGLIPMLNLKSRVPIPLDYFFNQIRQAFSSKASIYQLPGMKKCDIKDYKEGFICNPRTGRWVEPTGTVANELINTFGMEDLADFSQKMALLTKKERMAVRKTLAADLAASYV